MVRVRTASNNFSVVEVPRPQREERQMTSVDLVNFGKTVVFYGAGMLGVFRYIMTMMQWANALGQVDKQLMRDFHHGLDWNFFAPFGLISLTFEMYSLTLTFGLMINQYEALSKPTDSVAGRLARCSSFMVTVGCMIVILAFYILTATYHYMVIHKVLSLSPNGALAVKLFNNHNNIRITGFHRFAANMSRTRTLAFY